MQRPPQQSHISIPRQTKKVLSIVDPKTNQAVKVEKPSATPHAATKPSAGTIKIEPPKPPQRRPLSLEADPADLKPAQKNDDDASSVRSPDSPDSGVTEKTVQGSEPAETKPEKADDPIDKSEQSEKSGDVEESDTNESAPSPAAAQADSNLAGEEKVGSEESSDKKDEKDLETPSPIPAVEESEREANSVSTKTGGDPVTPAGDTTPQVVLKESSIDTDADAVDVDAHSSIKSKPDDELDVQDSMTTKELNIKPNDDNLDGMTSDVSSSTFADVRSDSTDAPPSNNFLSSKPSEDQPSSTSSITSTKPAIRPTIEDESQAQAIESKEDTKDLIDKSEKPAVSEDKETVTKPNVADGNDKKEEETPPMKEEGDKTDSNDQQDKAEETDTSNSKDNSPSTSQDEGDFGPSYKFAEGERRVYPPQFMRSMKTFANMKRVSEIINQMGAIWISAGGGNLKKSASRDSHVSRGSSGAMDSDPRRRAFAHSSMPTFNIPSVKAPSSRSGSGSFNLDDARRQAVPMLKSQGSNRDGDLRGRRTTAPLPHGRHSGGPPSRQFNTPVDPFITQPPVEKLKRSENAWKRDRESEDEKTRKVKEVRSLLNKLTLEKFDKIFKQIVDIDISSMDTLVGIVKEIFEKPLYEPKFSSMYAELCRRLDNTIQPILEKKEPKGTFNFRKILLFNCREEFTRFANSSANKENDPASKDSSDKEKADSKEKENDTKEESDVEKKDDTTGESKDDAGEKKNKEPTPQEKEDDELKAVKAKRRMLANVRFIGELFLKDLLKENIIHKHCIQKLLALANESMEEDVLEAVCKLISNTGAKLSSNAGAIDYINRYFAVLVGYSRDKNVPARIRFMIQDLVDQRQNGWKVRREEVGAKTIAEIHKDIAEKERAKQEAQNAIRDRRGRSGRGSMNGDRGPQPRIAMTMASASKGSNSGMSRTNMLLERGLNRSSNSSAASVRLGPAKSGLGAGGPGGPGSLSLRPQRAMSGSRFSALNSDSQERSNSNETRSSTGTINGGTASSLDPRRSRFSSSSIKAEGSLAKRSLSSRSSLTSTPTPEPEPEPEPKVELMEPAALKKKTKAIIEEYLTIEMIDEVVACLEEEVLEPNYPAFVENLVKITMEGKKDAITKTQKLVVSLISKKKLPASLFLAAFKKYGPDLQNIEMDFPLATELYSGLLAAASSCEDFRNLTDAGGKFGLDFVRKFFFDASDKVAPAKLLLMVGKSVQSFSQQSMSAEAAQQHAIDVYSAWNIDPVAEISAADPMGLKFFEMWFNRSGTGFLIPHYKLESELRSKMSSPDEDAIFQLLKSTAGDGELPLQVITIALRAALDEVTSDASSMKKKLVTVLTATAKALVKLLKKDDDDSVPGPAQFEAVCGTQEYFSRNSSRVQPAEHLPDIVTGTLMRLYDLDLVEEDTYREWKADTDTSVKRVGKQDLLATSAKFFKWLEEAETEKE